MAGQPAGSGRVTGFAVARPPSQILKLAGLTLVYAMSSPIANAQPKEPSFAGEYVMSGKGFSPNDSRYEGTCSIAQDDRAYRVSCFNQDTRHTYVGKGIAMGETLAIFIGDRLKGDHNSVFEGQYLVVYRRQPDGQLVGTWVHAEMETSGAETLTPKR